MRYAITSSTLPTKAIEDAVKDMDGKDLRVANLSKQVFVTLDPKAAQILANRGYTVSIIQGVGMGVVAPPEPIPSTPKYTPLDLLDFMNLDKVRNLVVPPVNGDNYNIAVLDTGVRTTHVLLGGKVIHSHSVTTPGSDDGFNHGTGVCSIIHAVAPNANIINIKVLNDNGEGTEEDVVMGLEYAASLTGNLIPDIINLSLGSPDDGNINNPMRIACREVINRGINVVAAAGNYGPGISSITTPANEKYVLAVGSIGGNPPVVSRFSSRGPTPSGTVKPDSVVFGEDIIMASNSSDTATKANSGTSFACPMATAVIVLVLDAFNRKVNPINALIPGYESQSVKFSVSNVELIDSLLVKMSAKPEGIVLTKDNSYGWGIPIGDLILKNMGLVPGAANPSLDTSMIGSMMQLMMMIMMMKSISKIEVTK